MASSARSDAQFIYNLYSFFSTSLKWTQYLKWQTYQLIHQVQASKYLCLFCPIRCFGQSPQFWSISVAPLGLNLVSYAEAHSKKRKKDEVCSQEQLAASLSRLPANFSCHPCPGRLSIPPPSGKARSSRLVIILIKLFTWKYATTFVCQPK